MKPAEEGNKTLWRLICPEKIELGRLSDVEQRVICLRFGLLEDKCKRSLREVGIDIGLSGERARQIQNKALRKLSRFVRAGLAKKAKEEK